MDKDEVKAEGTTDLEKSEQEPKEPQTDLDASMTSEFWKAEEPESTPWETAEKTEWVEGSESEISEDAAPPAEPKTEPVPKAEASSEEVGITFFRRLNVQLAIVMTLLLVAARTGIMIAESVNEPVPDR